MRDLNNILKNSLVFGLWAMSVILKCPSELTYADDTSSSVTGKTIEEVKLKLEEDAQLGLRFMASNGLVANPSKQHYLLAYYSDYDVNTCHICQVFMSIKSQIF